MNNTNNNEADTEAPTGSDAYIARRLEHRLKGNSLDAGVFKFLSVSQQDYLLSHVSLEPGELPVYGLYKNKTVWIFGTTRRLSWSRAGFEATLRYNEIEQIGSPERAERLTGPVFYTEDELMLDGLGQPTTVYLLQLSIKDNHGNAHAMLCDERQFSAIWSLIAYSVKLNRIHRN